MKMNQASRTPSLFIFTTLLLAFLFIQSCAQKEVSEITLPEGRTAEVVFIVGDVFVTKDGEWVKAQMGDILREGARIKTGADSYCEIVISSGTIFRLKDRSELGLVQLPEDERQNRSLVEIVKGELLTKTGKIAYRSSDEVMTSSVNLAVRGTEFLVHAEDSSEAGFTEVLVASGSVQLNMKVEESTRTALPDELREVSTQLAKGSLIKDGYKLKVANLKVMELNSALGEIAARRTARADEIERLKQETLLKPEPLDDADLKRLEEFKNLSLRFASGETYYVSPNFDGANDECVFDFSGYDFGRISGWKLVILDSALRVQKVLKSRPSERQDHQKLLEKIVWNVVGESGTVLPDGEYVYELYARYNEKKEEPRVRGIVVVDTVSPAIDALLEETIFSPNGDGVKDVLRIVFKTETGISWAGVITTPEGIVVRTIEWGEDIPEVFEWDGKGANGSVLPDGVYTLTITGSDRAGNRTVKVIKDIAIDTRKRGATVDADNPIFSPNGDGVVDSVTFFPMLTYRERIDTWDLVIQNDRGETARRFRGIGEVPEKIVWDGSPQKGKGFENLPPRLPSGKYSYFMKVIYRSGVNTFSYKKELILDVDPPLISVGLSPELFSPDGDGENDLLFIVPAVSDLSPIKSWKAEIYTVSGSLFKSFSGAGIPGEAITWDGVSERGMLVGSGDDYYLQFEAADSGGNTKRSEKIPFSIDILVVPTERGLKIQVSNIEFGFDTAELKGQKTFSILDRIIEVLKKYKRYAITVEGHTDSTGDEAYNVVLSKKRAESVGKYLTQHGIESTRLSYKGYGPGFPIDSNATPEGRARNRRVEFILEKR